MFRIFVPTNNHFLSKTIMLVLGIIIVVAVVAIGYFISTQRSLVSLDEMCKNALSQI